MTVGEIVFRELDPRVREVAALARQLIQGGWCRGTLAQNMWGHPEFTGSQRAVRWCLVGALKRAAEQCYRQEWPDVLRAARKALEPICGRDLSSWNDAPRRTKEQVLAVLEGL